MKTHAVRIYGKNDLRLEAFELPEIKDDEILAHVVADSLCMSSLKAANLGPDHKRVPKDVHINPVMIGHEFSGEIVQVGKKWKDKYSPGQKFSLQPALNYKGSMDSPGYSYKYCGGDATYAIIPHEVMELDCLIPYKGEDYFKAALSEPYSCVIGACLSMFRTEAQSHVHHMGIKSGGIMAILGGCGPMGLAAIDYAISGPARPRKLIVTDMDDRRLERARAIFSHAKNERGVELEFMNPKNFGDPDEMLMGLSENKGYDDILVMVVSPAILEQGDRLLGFNGCMNFFAGPKETDFSAKVNYYNVHYAEHHIIGTTGGNADDMRIALKLMEQSLLKPEAIVTHIGGLDSVINATLNLDKIPGGKKLIYTNISMNLTPIDEFEDLGKGSMFFKDLARIVSSNGGLWNVEAEQYVLNNAKKIG